MRPVSLLLACVLALATARVAAAVNLAAVPIGRTDLHWWKARFERSLVQVRERRPRLLWLGDSITQNWERRGAPPYRSFHRVWRRYYGRYRPVNLGFIGDTTASVLWRLAHGEVAGADPRLCIVLIGANNLGRTHWGVARTVPGIEAVVRSLRRRLPHTRILLLGILPSHRSRWISANTRRINAALARRYAGARHVTFVDVGHVLMHDGRLDESLFLDPRMHPPRPALHPDARGMARIARAIAPLVARLMRGTAGG